MAKTKGPMAPLDSNQDWRVESDARTLSEAQLIQADKARHGKALKKAKQMAETKMQEARELKKLGKRPRY